MGSNTACFVTGSQLDDAQARLGMYHLLSRLYREEIDENLLKRFSSEGTLEALQAIGLDFDLVTETTTWLQQLGVEYTHLFIGPGPHVSPHESVHAPGGSGLLNNERTAMVRRFVSVTGFDFEPAYTGYPDHISTELEFMEALIGCQLASMDKGDSEEFLTSLMLQKEFLNRHLLTWIPAFCDRVSEMAELPFYKSLAVATEQFIELEKNTIKSDWGQTTDPESSH